MDTQHRHTSAEHDATAARCPLCLAREAAADVGPEVVAHLRAAGRELLLALAAALDAHAVAHPPQEGRDAAAEASSSALREAAGDDAPVGRLRRIPVE
ncbi:MAG TPA: hypothetical protein VIK95_03090 [Egibacteraceae bacterium]